MALFKSSQLALLAFGLFSACGPQFSPNTQGEITTDALTEGQNQDGRSYTAFSPPSTVQSLKEQISFSEANKKFANNVETVEVNTKNSQIKITIKWKGLKEPLVFQGEMKPKEMGFNAQLIQKRMPQKDLEINAHCESLKCEKLDAFLKDQSGNLIGLVVQHEERNIIFIESTKQKISYKSLSPEKQNAIALAKNGLSVILNSVEVYPGRSYYEIKRGENSIEGELLNIDAGAAPTKTRGSFALLGLIELIGNNQGEGESGGELQFKVTNEIDKKQIVSYLKMETRFSLFLQPTSIKNRPNIHPLIQQILDDENNDIVRAYIENRLIPKTNLPQLKSQSSGVEEVSKYLACEESNRKLCGIDNQGHDKVETAMRINQVLKQQGLPIIWSLIAFMESRFELMAHNTSSGALGPWQFIYSTAKDPQFKLIRNGLDLRTDLKASTEAAITYFKVLLRQWNGDVKMAIISYNMGQGAVARACMKGSENRSNCNIAKNHASNQHQEISELYNLNKEDFWKLYKLHSFGAVSANAKSGQDYALKFLGESLVSFHPLQYGYGNHAVELN